MINIILFESFKLCLKKLQPTITSWLKHVCCSDLHAFSVRVVCFGNLLMVILLCNVDGKVMTWFESTNYSVMPMNVQVQFACSICWLTLKMCCQGKILTLPKLNQHAEFTDKYTNNISGNVNDNGA